MNIKSLNFLPDNGPRQVYFTPSYYCNSDCIMCGVAKWKREQKQGFPIEKAKLLIDNMKLCEEDAVELSGGEPTVYKGFKELVEYIKHNYGSRVVVLSHGRSLKNKKFVESIANCGIDRFVIPLFSHLSDVHDQITQVKGSFEETVSGFRALEEFNIPFSLKFITMKPNFQHALKTYEFKNQNFPNARFIISGYQLMGEAITNDNEVSIMHSQAGPEIEKVLEQAENNGEVVPVFMFPMCHIDPSFWKFYGVGVWHEEVVAPDAENINLSSELNYEEKHPKCTDCLVSQKCVWAWKKYTQRFGSNELKPYAS
ncbi:radical SAM protein [Terasakiella sp. SH-1]|uniref:radical SAM protein n=1 Tax=Terasakiella sp. SH-1 TaxID=2560057 RepID=UPI0010731656|nr:radical SAM protein [Terasakiella sp. SH-1]